MNESGMNVLVGAGVTVFFIVWLLMMALAIFVLVAQWHLYKKANRPGWAAIVPVYNVYVLTDIVWGNGWLFFLLLIPVGNLVFGIWTCVKLARVFGKSGGYGIGIVFLPFVFIPMLAFGKAQYEGPSESGKKGVIIATAVTGVVGTILLIVAVSAMVASVQKSLNNYDTMTDMTTTEIPMEEPVQDDAMKEDANAMLEGYDGFVMAELSNGDKTILMPMLEEMTQYGSFVSGEANGISVDLSMGYSEDGDAVANVKEEVENYMELYADLSEYYVNITTDEMITGDGFALQQINFVQKGFDGVDYPGFRIIKCDIQEGYPVIIDIAIDNYSADENTAALFKSACELYGIEFEFGS